MNVKLATAIIALVLLVMAGMPAGADAAWSDERQDDLTSLAKIEAYLGTMGIAIDSVVVQQGRYNYAGPNCPGTEWNCTTASKVVQLSTAALPAANVVDCSPAVNVALLGLDECVIVQSSLSQLVETTNMANCDVMDAQGAAKTKQTCKAKQYSKKGNNYAEVRMRTTQRGGASQTATQVASIEQMSESGSNRAKITQTMDQSLSARQSGSVTQSQVACQHASVMQTSTTGDSSSDVQQYQTQTEDAESSSSIDQEQNLTTDPTNCPLGQNVEATVQQLSDTGNITSNLRQLVTQRQDADSRDGPVTQTQSNDFGGLYGKVTQDTDDPGVLRSTSAQDERQTQDADTTSVPAQLQFGPEFCCATQSGGTVANVNTVSQTNVQQNTTGLGQSTQQHGECSTNGGGECTATQTYTSNSGTQSDSDHGAAVSCNNFGEGLDCQAGGGE